MSSTPNLKVFQGYARLATLVLLSSLAILCVSLWAGRVLKCIYSGELSGWVQAVGAILAIVFGFATAAYQARLQQIGDQEEKAALARAAHLLAFEALETISERLNTALTPKGAPFSYALRGSRTTEMVSAMREFDTSKLPTDMITDFIRLRSHIFAINERISEVYAKADKGSANQRGIVREKRHSDLNSAVQVRKKAIQLFESLRKVAVSQFGAEIQNVEARANLDEYDPTKPIGELIEP